MLILGILAAIALPAFFNQKAKAGDAKAKEYVHSAQVAMETYSTDNNGSYEIGRRCGAEKNRADAQQRDRPRSQRSNSDQIQNYGSGVEHDAEVLGRKQRRNSGIQMQHRKSRWLPVRRQLGNLIPLARRDALGER